MRKRALKHGNVKGSVRSYSAAGCQRGAHEKEARKEDRLAHYC